MKGIPLQAIHNPDCSPTNAARHTGEVESVFECVDTYGYCKPLPETGLPILLSIAMTLLKDTLWYCMRYAPTS